MKAPKKIYFKKSTILNRWYEDSVPQSIGDVGYIRADYVSSLEQKNQELEKEIDRLSSLVAGQFEVQQLRYDNKKQGDLIMNTLGALVLIDAIRGK